MRRLQRVRPQTGLFGVGFDQPDLFCHAAGQGEVVERLLVDREHRGRGAEFRRHVGDGGAIAQGQGRGALTEEFQIGADDLFLAQKFGQGQDDVGGCDIGLRLTRQLDADDVRQAHPRGAAEHDVFGLQAPHTYSYDTKRIDVRCVAVGTDQCIGKGDAVLGVDDR